MASPVELLAVALDDMAQFVGSVGDDHWTQPTPCTDWSVRELLNHFVGGNYLYAAILRGEQTLPPMEIRSSQGRDRLGEDPLAAYRDAAAELLAAFRQPGRPGADLRGADRAAAWSGSGAPAPGRDARTRLGPRSGDWPPREFLGRRRPGGVGVHSRRTHPNPSGSAFSAPQPVADDAPPLDRLVALLGRPVQRATAST